MRTHSPRIRDPLDFAWAAGFFDGEGSTIARSTSDRPGYRQLNICVPQSGHEGIPLVLVRFRRVMFELGTISGPGTDGMYFWRVFGREEVLLVLSLMWPYLGVVKRTQAEQAIALFRGAVHLGRLSAATRPPPGGRRVESRVCGHTHTRIGRACVGSRISRRRGMLRP